MKILINLAVLLTKPTGISNYALNIIPYLKELEPTLLVAQNQSEYTCRLIPSNLSPEKGSLGHLRRLAWTEFQLPQIYQQEKASLLFSPIPEAPIITKCNSVVMVHDLIPIRFPKATSPLTPYFRYYVPAVVQKAEHVICNSYATARDIQEFWNIPAKKISPIHLAYDREHFKPIEDLDAPDIPYFIYLGRHDPHKNLSRLVAAFGTIASQYPHQLWLVGPQDTRYTPLLHAQATALGLEDRIKFINYAPYKELPRLLNQATALVYPSLWEGFGLPILEAMGCGTPVITSNLASLPEITEEAGLLVNPYQIESIAHCMELVAKDQKERSRLSKLSLLQASKFSWANTGKATAEVLKRFSTRC